MKSFWNNLLVAWRKNGNEGLTLPYMIGSQQYLENNHEKMNINALIIDIASNKNGPIIFYNYCDTIGENVLGVLDDSYKEMKGIFPTYQGLQQNLFFRADSVKYSGETVEEIIENMNTTYQQRLINNEFSYNAGKWGDYTESEKKFIKLNINN